MCLYGWWSEINIAFFGGGVKDLNGDFLTKCPNPYTFFVQTLVLKSQKKS